MSKLIETLNANAHLTPDEIVAKISDPLSVWQQMTEFVTPENYESIQSRDVAMFMFSEHGRSGFYTHVREHMRPEGTYSYRTPDPEHAIVQNMESYDPHSAADCGGWWVIGWEFRASVPVPTTEAAPSHDRYEEPYEDDDYDDDPY